MHNSFLNAKFITVLHQLSPKLMRYLLLLVLIFTIISQSAADPKNGAYSQVDFMLTLPDGIKRDCTKLIPNGTPPAGGGNSSSAWVRNLRQWGGGLRTAFLLPFLPVGLPLELIPISPSV